MAEHEAPKITFPCDDYLIKVVGDADETFRQFVHQVLVAFDEQLTEASFSVNASRNGRFESLTVRMRIEHEDHLSELFEQLKADSRVRMVL
ncbi:MAG: HP0495 family protein [Saccharospirillum sp.]